VCGFVVGDVSPRDGALALRSFPRRFTELLEVPSGSSDDPDVRRAVVTRHAEAAAVAIRAAEAALERTLIEDQPVLGASSRPLEGEDAIERLRSSADELADLADRTPGSQWTRRATRGDGTVTALELLDEGVHAGSHHLREASAELG
jgi:hypothetical protein